MASDVKTVTLIPLNGYNYPMWKVQCRMALMKDGLWNIVSGAKTPPAQTEGDKVLKVRHKKGSSAGDYRVVH